MWGAAFEKRPSVWHGGRQPQRWGNLMGPLFAPYRICRKFARCNVSKANALPVAWAVRVDGPKSARILADSLRRGGASRIEVVAGPARRAFVRWAD